MSLKKEEFVRTRDGKVIFRAFKDSAQFTESQQHGKWNSGRGTRKELEEDAEKLRKQVKREKAIWDRYAKAKHD